ncbi:hypothetical protein ITJ54_04660 [Curtobacterium sp. VKM Ac-2865]|uniref:hypothetical protein n=1 Tax=Curtobacterium sp. VKM Ac-2865 TaxID=2783817 RepID=UPI00188B93A2|nr:hypothetical protein [Curtobacterium sp. VKM Ac-2865]MBF4581955.1 hypothetical protein [Curtobacterium sp. VKM Ac-2865]
MHLTTTSSFRRYAAVGTAIAIVSMSSAFGIGATAAVAAETPTTTPTTSPTDAVTTSATTATDAPADSDTAAAPSSDATPAAPTDATPTAASPTAPTDATPAAPTDATPTGATPTAPTDATPAAPTADLTPSPSPVTAAATGTVAVTGTATAWRTLAAETTGWPTGTTFTYQWTATKAGTTTEVRGATASTYVIDPEDAGSTLAVAVNATAPGAAPETATSAPTGVVAADDSRFREGGGRDFAFTAGDDVSIDLRAFAGDQGGLTYRSSLITPPVGSVAGIPDGLELTSGGYLVGTPTLALRSEFVINAVTTRHPEGVGMVVNVDVAAGAPAEVGVVAYLETDQPQGQPVWAIAPDGTVTYSDSPEVQDGDPTTPFRVHQDDELSLHTYVSDAYGNGVFGAQTTWTSSVAGDTFTSAEPSSVILRFAHASPHVITATVGGVSRPFTIQVDPVGAVTTTPAATGTGTATPVGQLAFTGADTTGPLAWALGLLASGAALLLVRLRRRRA